jgi:hypothetical protein
MHALGSALIVIGVGTMLSVAPAEARSARFLVEYDCRDSSTLIRLASARERAHPRIFQSHVHQAVVTGRCKIVRYHRARPSKAARRRAKAPKVALPVRKREGVASATVRESPRLYVPAGAAPTIRVSHAAAERRYNSYMRFPTPQTFMPVR